MVISLILLTYGHISNITDIWSYVIFVLEIMSSVTVISSRVCMVWYMVICDIRVRDYVFCNGNQF